MPRFSVRTLIRPNHSRSGAIKRCRWDTETIRFETLWASLPHSKVICEIHLRLRGWLWSGLQPSANWHMPSSSFTRKPPRAVRTLFRRCQFGEPHGGCNSAIGRMHCATLLTHFTSIDRMRIKRSFILHAWSRLFRKLPSKIWVSCWPTTSLFSGRQFAPTVLLRSCQMRIVSLQQPQIVRWCMAGLLCHPSLISNLRRGSCMFLSCYFDFYKNVLEFGQVFQPFLKPCFFFLSVQDPWYFKFAEPTLNLLKFLDVKKTCSKELIPFKTSANAFVFFRVTTLVVSCKLFFCVIPKGTAAKSGQKQHPKTVFKLGQLKLQWNSWCNVWRRWKIPESYMEYGWIWMVANSSHGLAIFQHIPMIWYLIITSRCQVTVGIETSRPPVLG